MRRGVTMIETLAATVLVAMMAVALMHTATIVRVAHRRASESAVRAERVLMELRARAVTSRERMATEGRGVEGTTVFESSLAQGSLGVGREAGWIVVSEDGVGAAVWCGRLGGPRR